MNFTVRKLAAQLSLGFLSALLATPAPGSAAGDAGPSLTPADERALADDFLFCFSLANLFGHAPDQTDAQKRSWENQRLAFFTLAVTLIPDAELRDRVPTATARFDDWVKKVTRGDELRTALLGCVQKRDANQAWLMERRRAQRAVAAGAQDAGKDPAFTYDGLSFVHRWSRAGQHEFTPVDQPDLARWTRMVTINVSEQVGDGDGLAKVADAVLGNYQRAGRIVRTASKPRTTETPAEHFVSAVLTLPGVTECVFARFLLHDGRGVVVVSSIRTYGDAAEENASAWLARHAAEQESALMRWEGIPRLAALRAIPETTR